MLRGSFMRSDEIAAILPIALTFSGCLIVMGAIAVGGGFGSSGVSVPILLWGIAISALGALLGAARPAS